MFQGWCFNQKEKIFFGEDNGCFSRLVLHVKLEPSFQLPSSKTIDLQTSVHLGFWQDVCLKLGFEDYQGTCRGHNPTQVLTKSHS